MPYIEVKMYPGRSEEVKKEFAAKVRACAAETMGADPSVFSVGIVEVQPENWNAEVAETVPAERIYAGEMFVAK